MQTLKQSYPYKCNHNSFNSQRAFCHIIFTFNSCQLTIFFYWGKTSTSSKMQTSPPSGQDQLWPVCGAANHIRRHSAHTDGQGGHTKCSQFSELFDVTMLPPDWPANPPAEVRGLWLPIPQVKITVAGNIPNLTIAQCHLEGQGQDHSK